MQEDYWDFVLGLRQLQPVLAPSVDRIHRQAGEQGVDRGGMWLRTSLEAHTLASQLRLLVDDNEHLSKYYYGELFKIQWAVIEVPTLVYMNVLIKLKKKNLFHLFKVLRKQQASK